MKKPVVCRNILLLLGTLILVAAAPVAAETGKAPDDFSLSVDLACPGNAVTAKSGWKIWEIPGGCDGRPHDGAEWTNIAETGIDVYICLQGDVGGGNLAAGYGDPICNTAYHWHHAGNRSGSSKTFRHEGSPTANVQLKLGGPGLVAGEYWLYTYHCFPTRNDDMPSITVKGQGVVQLAAAAGVPVRNIDSDKELKPSLIKFYTEGRAAATVTYEAAKGNHTLESGRSSNAVVNAFRLVRKNTAPRPTKPFPANGQKYVPLDNTLSWDPGPPGATYNLYFAGSAGDLDAESEPDATGLTEPSYDAAALRGSQKLEEDQSYFWRVEYVHRNRKAVGDKWTFKTAGRIMLKADLALPMANGVPYPGTAKSGWTAWAHPGWADMYAHDGKWLRNIDGSGIDAFLTIGNEGMGALKVKNMRMHSKKGEGPPTGIPNADPICNSWFQAADWASYAHGESSEWGNILLLFTQLPAGQYTLLTYHNHWYHCDRYECDCLGMVKYRDEYRATRAEQGPMPSITVNALPEKPLPGYEKWALPRGTGRGVTTIQNVYHFTAQHVTQDEQLVPSVVKFKTDGSPVLVIYEAPQDYWDYRDYPGGRGILNAFILEQLR